MDTPLGSGARRWLAVNAIVAWLGVAVSLTLNAIDYYPPTAGTAPSHYGPGNAAGAAGLIPRLADWVSYFTILSNIVVAVVTTALATGRARNTAVWRALRLDTLILITITALVYAVVLAPGSVQRGWDNLSNSLIHQVTPALTVLVWVIAGPRGWLSWRTVAGALVVPIAWLVWMLGRGAVIGAYPYDFVDVVRLGYPQVLANVTAILVLGVVIAGIFLGIERGLAALGSRRTAHS